MANLKSLHLASSIDALDKLFILPKSIETKKVMQLCISANNLKKSADEFYLQRDEESAYVSYMKYLNLVNTITKHRDLKENKKNIMETLGSNRDFRIIYDKVERLKASLCHRYSANVTIKEDVKKIQNLQDHSMPQLILTTQSEHSISAKQLFEMINSNQVSMLILDCRSEEDFTSSQIKYNYMVNVPDTLLVTGMTAGKIHDRLPLDCKTLWTSRNIKEQIVLMDNNTKGIPPKDSPLWVLENILTNWDPDVIYRKPFLKVDGGFMNFILHYPMCCTNPNYFTSSNDLSDNPRFEDIEYPNLSDIRMKDDSFGAQLGRPTVDRNSKAAALQIYDAKTKGEILDEQEKLVDKSIRNEHEMLTAENELKQIHDVESVIADIEEKEELHKKTTELRNRLLQLENKHKDYLYENKMLQDQVLKYEEKERKEQGDRISNEQAAALEEQARRRIQEKEDEQKRLDSERARLAEEREKQEELIANERKAKLQAAYEYKRLLKENFEAKEKRIPQFDRSAKPTGVLSDYNHNVQREIQRDFSPVFGNVERGLTGLKNLGNTCYMNSILQCLSNTTLLREFFQSGLFRKNLNRNNKTQGRIAEEVAAVIKELWTGQYKCIASKNLRYVVGLYERQFGGIEQQDSHEFLTILMDWLHSDLQTVNITIATSIDNLPASEKAWVEYFRGKESYIAQLSYGQIKSTVKCVHCGKESATYESFSSLSLELPSDANKCHLNDCLGMYFHGELIRGWNCPQCKSNQDAIKKLDISRLPSVLIVHFKRFYADPDVISTVYKKKQNYVKFPLVQLDMSPHVAPSEMSRNQKLKFRRYQLYGVSNHYGSMESGHYTAFCHNMEHQRWYKFDDHTVSSLDRSDVCSSAAYILFYAVLTEDHHSDMQMR